jgi:1,4-alpha-glucan branching enzyme
MPAKKVAKKKAPKKASKVRETFELNAPDAGTVLLVGDFTDWEENPRQMKRLKSGVWKVQVTLDAGQSVQYRFLVDGTWVDDSECLTRVQNGMGGENCVRNIGA